MFIKNYSQITTSLTRLTYKDTLDWSHEVEKAFKVLKKAFTTAPILVHPDFSKPFFMKTDASDFALGVLSQPNKGKKLPPVAFRSRKFSAIEINYKIHDEELLAIVDSFQDWRHLLEGFAHQVTVYTNHKNLEYFMFTRALNRRQARWNMSLSRFDFGIIHRPGKQQRLLDALSRRSNLIPKEGEAAYDQQQTTLLKPECLYLQATSVFASADSSFLEEVRKTSVNDLFVLNIKKQLSNSSEDLESFKIEDQLLYFEDRLYVLDGLLRLQVLQA